MVLRGDELLPVVDRIGAKVWPRVSDVIAENVLLEIGFPVRRLITTEAIETREERFVRVRASTIDASVATAAGDRIRLCWRHAVDELAEAVDYDRAHSVQAIVAPSIRARPFSSSTHGRFCQGGS